MALYSFSSALDPVSALLRLQQELDRALERPRGFDLGVSGRGVFPPVNIFRDADGYVVRLEVPGVSPNDVRIESEGRTLTISGKRESRFPEGGSLHRRERSSGSFSRSLQVPAVLDLSKADASCNQGVLTIRIPKREEAKPRQITVRSAK